MPLDEGAKKELADKIREHRRRIWLGEIADDRKNKREKIVKTLEEVDELEAPDPLVIKPARKGTAKAEREFWVPNEGESSSRSVNFGVLVLVLSGLITSVAVGILIGYLFATFL